MIPDTEEGRRAKDEGERANQFCLSPSAFSLLPSSFARRLGLFVFVTALLASRGCQIASKPLHHDESLFGYYSYYFAHYNHYEYDPILHGPLLIELTGMIFRLFGDNDLTLRAVPFVSGLLLFPLLLALRPWLGRQGTLAALLLLLVSPNLCYYSRFLRNDVLFLMLTLTNLVAIAYALKSERPWPLLVWPVSFALLCSVKENVALLAASQVGFAILWIALDDQRIAKRQWSNGRELPARDGATVRALKLTNVALVFWCAVAWVYAYFIRPRVPLGFWAPALWLIGVATTASLLGAISRAIARNPGRIGLVFRLYERIYCDRYWWIAGFALAGAALCFCYSICLTQPKPILSLFRRATSYWWGEHASERLGGPFHYYASRIALYELPALGIILVALAGDWARNGRTRIVEAAVWLLVGIAVWAASFRATMPSHIPQPVLVLGPAAWSLYDGLSEQLRDSWSYIHLRSIGELFWAASVAYWGGIWTVRSLRSGRPVRAWFIFWLATSYLLYGYVGEKVPWLGLHILLPLWLLAALLWNEWTDACAPRHRRGFVAALFGALLLWNAWQTYVLCFIHPTSPSEIAIYNHTCEPTQQVAWKLVSGMEKGEIEAQRVAVQGEASWPLTWYLRRYRDVRFEQEAYQPSATDAVVVADPGADERVPMLRLDFEGKPFELRSSWVPPTMDVGEVLCLRPVVGEPEGAKERLLWRFRHSGAILKTLARYVLFRCAYGYLPSPPRDEPFGTVDSILWIRQRPSPDPLLPPVSENER